MNLNTISLPWVGKAKKIAMPIIKKSKGWMMAHCKTKVLHEKSHFINGPNKGLGFRHETAVFAFVEIICWKPIANNQ
jgi:hypothetical protein